MTSLRPPVRELGLAEAVERASRGAAIIDVRERDEWDAGHIVGAVHLPLAELPARIGEVAPDPHAQLLLVCAVGARSGRAATWLAERGYTDVANLRAPLERWPAAGGAWDRPAHSDASRRYARQLALPEIGEAGQARIRDARVVLIGAGGLGSPAALYLAAAGVGTLSIVDDDTVDESNLARQLLHATDRIGTPKVESAMRTLHALNAETAVEAHAERLDARNADQLIAGADVVIDGSDNLATRYALNDAAVRLRIPLVHGSIHRWEGAVTTLVPFAGPCYRCLHPEPPPPELSPDCAVAGVVGVLPGIVGTLQATEALKLILGAGRPLVGRLLLVDALGGAFEEVRAARDPACAACGERSEWARPGR